jgi:hypothetical protein
MDKWMLTFCLLVTGFLDCPGQTNQTAPPTSSTSPPATSTQPSSSGNTGRAGQITDRRQLERIDRAFEALRNLEIPQKMERSPASIMSEEIHPLYRKPGKKELKNLLPSRSLLAQYEKFLQEPETGIFKLSAESSCALSTQVVVATEKCLSVNIPGAGTAYSFRAKSHRMLHLSDLILDKNVIKTDSLLQQGLMVNLGNIELDQVSAQTAGMKYLFDLKPAANKEELLSLNEKLSQSVKADGFTYSFGLYVEDKTTFALRSIAYRGKIRRSISGFKYNEMDFDKRKDIIVVFRIIEKDPNGDITVLWKEIFRQDSPVIKIDDQDK